MKIVFMGTPEYATVIFQKLLESNYDIVALFTQPDKKVGRKQILTPPHIKQFCLDNGLSLPIYQPNNLKDENTVKIIKNLKPNFIIVAAFGQILPQNILDIAPCINLHASLLPRYRGASPIQQAILNDDQYTGVTAMMMEKGLDTGDILGLEYIKITSNMYVTELFEKLSVVAANLTIDTIEKFDIIKPKKQNSVEVSYCPKIEKNDGLIQFDDAKNIYQKFKAYKSWPGIFLKSGLKIKECELVEITSSHTMGEIIEINNDSIIIACSIGSLRVTEVQPVSKKSMKAVDFIRGARLGLGTLLK